jgi:hypothetical protein
MLFLVWFLSGFVMIFHRFPKVPVAGKYACMDAIEDDAPAVDTILQSLPPGRRETLRSLSLKTRGGHAYVEPATDDSTYASPAGRPGYPYIKEYAKRWADAEIVRVDTLYELEQWIPFSRLRNDFPIYKFYFGDRDRRQLYVSSLTGEALQLTDKSSRFWAWVGAIPHWVYFTSLRQNAQLWMDVVVWLSGAGCVMCLAGIILGIRSYLMVYRRKKKWKTPYRKPAYKWHHILGFTFGIFVFTFVFSGMMSLATVPGWMVKVHRPDLQRAALMPEPVILRNYTTDYRQILRAYPSQVKSIEWTSFAETPVYKAIIGDTMHFFHAGNGELAKLYVDEGMIRRKLSDIHPEPLTIRLMQEYDHYYIDRERTLPLPVYKVDVEDADRSTYYIVPESGAIRYFNTNTKTRRWMYQTLHSFESGFLVKHPILWTLVMWITMIGGTLVAATGVWLGIRYMKRHL